MPILTYIEEISPRPVLFIHGEKAHSRYFTETAYEAAAEPKAGEHHPLRAAAARGGSISLGFRKQGAKFIGLSALRAPVDILNPLLIWWCPQVTTILTRFFLKHIH